VNVVNDDNTEQKRGFGGTGAAMGGGWGGHALLGLLLLVEDEDYSSEYGLSQNVKLSDTDDDFPTEVPHDTDPGTWDDLLNLASEHNPEERDFVIDPGEGQ
jgi:hypothetical protein